MLEARKNLAGDTFAGVRFVLFGFDPIKKELTHSKLCGGGGIDAVNYGPNCTHVIVDKLIYDDPICVLARREGKTVVTALWVDHSFDLGIHVDPSEIMYRPLKDLNGIPGAEHLMVCLTGYQRQDREDIMTMVGLMGATFSKALVASKVTHLVCYKFEGDKYELAKKVKTITFVNHHWLEDCLQTWKLLPESDYCKSAHELEMEMEAEAKDSEEETEDMTCINDVRIKSVVSPQNVGVKRRSSHQSPGKQENSRAGLCLSVSKSSANTGDSRKVLSNQQKEINLESVSTSKENCSWHFQNPTFCSTKNTEKITSEVPSHLAGAMFYERADDAPTPVSTSAKKSPISDASKLRSKSHLKDSPRKASLPLSLKKMERSKAAPSESEVDNDLVSGSLKMILETKQDEIDNDGIKTLLVGTELLPEHHQSAESSDNRKRSVPRSSLEGRVNHALKTLGDGADETEPERSALGCPLVDGSDALNGRPSPVDRIRHSSADASLAPGAAYKMYDLSEDKQEDKERAPQHSSKELERTLSPNFQHSSKELERTPSPNFHMKDPSSSAADNHPDEGVMDQIDQRRLDISEVERSGGQADLKAEQTSSLKKPIRRKMLAKKTLGPRPTISKASSAIHKGSVNLQHDNVENEQRTLSNGMEMVGADEAGMAEKVVTVPLANADERQKTKIDHPHIPQHEATNHSESVVNEETALHDEERNECDDSKNTKKDSDFEALHSGNMHSVQGGIINIKKQTERKMSRQKEKLAKSVEDTNSTKEKCSGDVGGKTLSKGKKRTLMKIKTTKLYNSEAEAQMDGFNNEDKTNRVDKETVPMPGQTKTKLSKKLKCSSSAEKENKPISVPEESSPDPGMEKAGPVAGRKKGRPSKKFKKTTEEKDNEPVTLPHESHSNARDTSGKAASQQSKRPLENCFDAATADNSVKTEPAWFILSGHKLQRKEFQQVIKRMRGRVCRDSHNWSYQATHFIVPDPIRRTEKFFAAAASGSWILKTDYLTASLEAGNFLSEEPYEWHKKGLSEDGAINLEAPRKWRLLKERTGHGAFYGTRIIIYGECIAPTLDTLKRVVKAGDGTILATSPPYTRFLQSRIDFAIISPGMPRADMWVQEFLSHKIPCVVSDYLVEYVCKPGYSLERHVQYNTHAWAEKSLKDMVRRVEEQEVTEGPSTPQDGVDDVACQVCGDHQRGYEMLLCGDESGSLGCGVGFHIDCLDPPLLDVPDEDWFCASCSKKNQSKSVEQNPKKLGSKYKK